MMTKKIKYSSANVFMFECAKTNVLPLIHWRHDELGISGFIYFKLNDEVHVFYSKDKKLLDAIFNSIGLIRHALKLVSEV